MAAEATTADLTQHEALARKASQAAKLALLVLAVAVAVLVIDQGIKRRIVDEGERALNVLAEAQKLVREAGSGRQEPAGEASAGPGDSVNPADGVDDAARASADAGLDAGNGVGPETGRVSRPFGGPRGDG